MELAVTQLKRDFQLETATWIFQTREVEGYLQISLLLVILDAYFR